MSAARTETLADGVTLYLGDCREILPTLPRVVAVVTDPPYGINQDRGMGGGGYDGFGGGVKRAPRAYAGNWDADRPDAETFKAILAAGVVHIIWGGNYFSDLLPVSQKWLFWDKLQTMPTYSDGEMAWTSLPGTSTKKFTYNGSGLMAAEKGRVHPTQKPVELLKWCIGLIPPPCDSDPRPLHGLRHNGSRRRQARPQVHRHRNRAQVFRHRLPAHIRSLEATRHVHREARASQAGGV